MGKRTFSCDAWSNASSSAKKIFFVQFPLISFRPALRNIIAFGTDGEEELYKAFGTQLPNSIHLQCFRHYRANIKKKLIDMGLQPDCVLCDIFGETIDSIDYVHGIGNRRRFAHVQYERTLSSVVW